MYKHTILCIEESYIHTYILSSFPQYFCMFFKCIFIEVQMIYNVVLISPVEQ